MKLPSPDSRCPYVDCDIILADGQRYQTTSGGDAYVNVDDNAVEVLMKAYTPTGYSVSHAWTKEDGVHPVALYLKNQEMKKKLAAYEARQKTAAASETQRKRQENENVSPSPDVQESPSKD